MNGTRIKGVRDLVFDGVEVVTNLVEKTHAEASERWTERVALVPPAAPIARGVNTLQRASTALTCATIRFVSRGVGAVTRAVTDPLLEGGDDRSAPMRQDAQGSLPWWLDQAQGTLNGFVGDHLARRGNSLDFGMTLRHDGRAVPLEASALAAALPEATSGVCLFVHGLSTTEWSWMLHAKRFWGDPGTCYGTKLRDDLGFTPLYVRYNTGRHVSENGRALSDLIEVLARVYPVPIAEVAVVGHSMGGLVARSAAHAGAASGATWVRRLRHVFCIGAPHLGAPLEKGASVLSAVLRRIPAAGATVPAAVIDARSDGIKDLRHGYTTDEEWREGADADDLRAVLRDSRHDVPLVDGVGYYAVATTITRDPEHPAGQLLGDLLVRAPSGTGQAPEPERHIAFRSKQVIPGMNHLHIANHPAVYDVLVGCLAE